MDFSMRWAGHVAHTFSCIEFKLSF
jgi:hypothetical protein